jgi:hypothetical protein
MSDSEQDYQSNDERDPELLSAIDRQLLALGAHKKKHRKHKHHRHHVDDLDLEELGNLDDYDLKVLTREVNLLQAEVNTSVAPSMAESESVAGGEVAGKKRLKKTQGAGALEEEEEPVEQAKKRRIKEKQKREADEEIDRRNAEERKKKVAKQP